jgi:hypothetical protein
MNFVMCQPDPKARFVIAYVNDYIQREKNRTVNMGDSLREAMEKMNISVGGKNGKELTREVKNFAAAEIGIVFRSFYESVGMRVRQLQRVRKQLPEAQGAKRF